MLTEHFSDPSVAIINAPSPAALEDRVDAAVRFAVAEVVKGGRCLVKAVFL